MKITVVNFGDEKFRLQQRYCSLSSRYLGHADSVISYGPGDIRDYLDRYPEFGKYKKGFGNYFWKPYIIQKGLESVAEGDYLIYIDSGSFVLKDLRKLCRYLEQIKKDILVFESPLISKQWTKMDAFLLLNADTEEILNSNQLLAGYIVIKNTKEARLFIENYRKTCTDERIVSDMDNVMGSENFSDFIEHRHDQSVLTILARNSEIVQIEKDLSDYGVYPEGYIADKRRLYDESAFDKTKYKFKGYVLSNRKAHPIWYALKYFIKRVVR